MLKNPHPEMLKAELRIRYGSLRKFELQHRLPINSVVAAIRRPHRAAEKAIARALDVPAVQIWPTRYHANGRRLSKQPTINYTSARGKSK